MAYGIGSVIGDIDQKVDTYRNNPEALAQMYQQNQQLIDLLALQKLKTEKEAAMRDMQMKMQTPAASIKDQREQEVMGMMRNEVAQQVAPGLQVAGQQAAQAAAPPVPQGGGLQSLPAPNMQGMGMAEGGIVAFAGEGSSQVKSTSAGDEADADSWLDEFGGAAAVAALYGDNIVNRIKAGGPAARAAARWLKANASRALPAARTLSTAAIPAASAVTTYNTPTEQYAERFGFDPNKHGLLRDLGIRGLGAISDLGNVGSFGLAGKLFRDKQNAEARRTPAVPATPEISDPKNEANVMEMLGGNIRPTPPPSVTPITPQVAQPATPEISDPKNEANVVELLGGNIRPITTQAAPQEQPQYRSRYEDQLAALETEGQDKMGALIDFLQGAGGKTSFAATMAGGGSRLRERDARLKQEKADVLKNLILDERDQQLMGFRDRELAQQADLATLLREQQERIAAADRTSKENLTREEINSRRELAELQSNEAIERAKAAAGADLSETQRKLYDDARTAMGNDTIFQDTLAALREQYENNPTKMIEEMQAAGDEFLDDYLGVDFKLNERAPTGQ